MFACVLADIVHQFTGAETVIMGDVTYGACCIDDLCAKELGCDFMVHYGHSCLVPVDVTSPLPILYVFVEITFDVATAYTHNFDNVAVETFSVVGQAYGPNGVTLTDPGAWLKLITAPESRAEALARKASLLRDAKKLKKKFKKAKRKGQIKKARTLKKKFRRAKVKARKVVIPADPEEFTTVTQEFS